MCGFVERVWALYLLAWCVIDLVCCVGSFSPRIDTSDAGLECIHRPSPFWDAVEKGADEQGLSPDEYLQQTKNKFFKMNIVYGRELRAAVLREL